jgi:NAD(P)-dependent dehydrogenase (short-subunit alcohol dehydrogenase family)
LEGAFLAPDGIDSGQTIMAAPMIKFDFSGKNAIVTGAGGGMGEAIALSLLQAGCAVTAIDIKPRPKSYANCGAALNYVQGDLTDPEFVERTIENAFTSHGRLDYLANVAGVLWFARDGSILDIDMRVWDQVFDINLKSMVHTSRSAVPLMRRSKPSGAMVHVSTTQWLRGDLKPQDAYQASKAGVCALSKSLAMQLAADGIRSNAILPGMTLTPLQSRWGENDMRAIADYVPIKRIGSAQDMANVALFLLSDEASYITGTDVIVDGGLMMRV